MKLSPAFRLSPFFKLLIPLFLGFVASVAVMVFSEISHQRLNDANVSMANAIETQAVTSQILALVTDAETAQRGFLLTGRPEYLEPYVTALPKIEPKLQTLADFAAKDPEQRARVNHLNNLIGRKFAAVEAALSLQREKGAYFATELIKTDVGRKIMDEIRAEIEALQNGHRAQLISSTYRWNEDVAYSRFGLALITAFNLILLLVIYVYANRELLRRERDRTKLLQYQKELEEQVKQRTEELDELAINLQQVQEQEKAKLARDIHDELGSILVSAKMDLSWAQNRAREGDPAVGDKLRRAMATLDEGVQIKRRLIEDLRPTLLDNLGLGAAIQWHVNGSCEKGGVQCAVSVPEEEMRLPSTMAIALFRIVQEAVTNILRHARARHASISLKPVQDGVRLEIRDDGIGINAEALRNKLSHGVIGMRQRISALGGKFKIEGKSGEGTRIEVFVPLAEEVAPALVQP